MSSEIASMSMLKLLLPHILFDVDYLRFGLSVYDHLASEGGGRSKTLQMTMCLINIPVLIIIIHFEVFAKEVNSR